MTMQSLPNEIISILILFAPLFNKSTWCNAKELLIGAILTKGDRTISNILRTLGLQQDKNFDKYYKILNRAKWSTLGASAILLLNIIAKFNLVKINILIDTTIDRRYGPKIIKKGNHRDPVRSSKSRKTFTDSLRWLNLMVLVPIPWSNRLWALPYLSVLIPSSGYCASKKKKYKTDIDFACQAIMFTKRLIPNLKVNIIGDGDFGNVKFGKVCKKYGFALVARMRDNAVLYSFPDNNQRKHRGRAPTKGSRLTTLKEIASDTQQKWQTAKVSWYDGEDKELSILTGKCLRYVKGYDPLPIQWVVTKDPLTNELTYIMCTDLEMSVVNIIELFVGRWNIEVTHEEARRYLGVETLRNWSEKSVDRGTPILFSMYTIIVLMTLQLNKNHELEKQNTAWYYKEHCTFSDCLALIRVHLWKSRVRLFNQHEDREVLGLLYELTRAA